MNFLRQVISITWFTVAKQEKDANLIYLRRTIVIVKQFIFTKNVYTFIYRYGA